MPRLQPWMVCRIPEPCTVAHSYKMTQVIKGQLPNRNTGDHTSFNNGVRLLFNGINDTRGKALAQVVWASHSQKETPVTRF